jgi:hypothetical protein
MAAAEVVERASATAPSGDLVGEVGEAILVGLALDLDLMAAPSGEFIGEAVLDLPPLSLPPYPL